MSNRAAQLAPIYASSNHRNIMGTLIDDELPVIDSGSLHVKPKGRLDVQEAARMRDQSVYRNNGKKPTLCPHGVLGITKCKPCQNEKRRNRK